MGHMVGRLTLPAVQVASERSLRVSQFIAGDPLAGVFPLARRASPVRSTCWLGSSTGLPSPHSAAERNAASRRDCCPYPMVVGSEPGILKVFRPYVSTPWETLVAIPDFQPVMRPCLVVPQDLRALRRSICVIVSQPRLMAATKTARRSCQAGGSRCSRIEWHRPSRTSPRRAGSTASLVAERGSLSGVARSRSGTWMGWV